MHNYLLLLKTEIDECENNNCSPNATCIDKLNGFDCVCNTGFTGEGTSCTGISLKLLIKCF